jgi:hypothetical protein
MSAEAEKSHAVRHGEVKQGDRGKTMFEKHIHLDDIPLFAGDLVFCQQVLDIVRPETGTTAGTPQSDLIAAHTSSTDTSRGSGTAASS